MLGQSEGTIMRTYLEKRLETLITEHSNGQTALKNLDAQRVQLQETMLRITGAIQVVQEALKDGPPEPLIPVGDGPYSKLDH